MASETPSPTNVILVVWDACRFDYASEHATELTKLASENVWFERAIAPSPWSLPSHASLFTGVYPHEHGCHRLDGSIDTTLVKELCSEGYHTAGISGNGFASQRTGFHKDFDEFYYTGGRERYLEGMDVSGFAQRLLEDENTSPTRTAIRTLQQIGRHSHPLKSLANFASVAVGELADSVTPLQRIPHPIVSPDSGYCYTPERNTRRLRSVIQDSGDTPFFVFMNYMDTHRPYKPRPELQSKHFGRELSFRELRRLNEHVAYPWEFIDELENGTIDEDDVEIVRKLYAGEVETADEHLRRIREILDKAGKLDETLIIVTGDHGENLGEADERGLRRMGHEASVSDAVLHVPLLLAHPDLDERVVTEPVSLKNLYELVLEGIPTLLNSHGGEIPGLISFDGVTASQYPATGGQMFFERHPEVSEEIINHRVADHSAVTYDEDWKVIVESTGEKWAGTQDGEHPYDEAPDLLVDTAEEQLRKLEAYDTDGELSNEEISRLEALGYL
jgi:arylsulfatase A-like enzyme